MANDSVRSYESAAEITNFWIKNIMPRYFDSSAVNTYRAGTLGYTSDIMSTVTEDSFHAMMVAKREVLPNTAQYLSSLYLHGAARLMDAPMGTPAQANILLMIQQSELLKYGETEGRLHTFVLDDSFVALVGDIPFMLDYPIKILSVKRENGKYAHTTHYEINMRNSLVTSEEKYLPNKMMNYQGTEFLVMSVKMRQLTRQTQTALISSNTIVSTVTKEFRFDGTLANFEIFYKQDDTTPEVQLIKMMEDSVILHEPFCWYKVVNDSTLRITFPANIYFTPRLNSTITVNIYTTKGDEGNFDKYDSDIISDNDSRRYPYNAQVPVFGVVDGASSNGASIISQEDYRRKVMRAYATNMTFATENDLQMYFDSLMEGTSDRFKFTKQRDDSFVRLHGAFLRMKDEGNNVVPTNTLDLVLDPQEEKADFDIYSDAVKKFIIRPGALFHYYNDEEHKYVVRRIKDRKLGEDISSYDAEGQWVCGSCGMRYEGEEGDFEAIFNDKENEYVCPHCGAPKGKFRKDNFIFCNPYLISVSTDNFMCGYYLNSVNMHKDIRYTAVNDMSIVQFVARHFKIERNAIAGENFYRFSIAVSPSVDIKLDTVFEEADPKDVIIAEHPGYVKDISFQDEAVYATIMYEPEPIPLDPDAELPVDEEGNEYEPEPEVPEPYEMKIQVSSFIRKVNKDFMICPECGKRHTLEEWAIMTEPITEEVETESVWDEEKGEYVSSTETITRDPLYDEEGVPIPCPQCQESGSERVANLIDYEKKFIDFDYFNGYDMKFNLGDRISTNDVIASAKPKDLGRCRVIMDLNNMMKSSQRRYIPMTIEATSTDVTTAPYFIYACYISTTDIIDSSQLMSVEDGFVMPDGSSGKNASLAIPIEDLTMEIHAFYEYREDDDLDIATRNPAHKYSAWPYVKTHTFTNTYALEENESFTLIKPLDHAKGFLDVFEREDIWEPPEIIPDPEPEPEPEPDPHPGEDDPWPDDPFHETFLRTVDHEPLMVEEHDNDRWDHRYLTVLKNQLPTDDPPEEEPYDPTKPDENGMVVTPVKPGTTVLRPYMPFGGNFMYLIRNCPMVSAAWIKQHKNEVYFIDRIYERYADIDHIHARLQNAFAIDMKFYNTYGKSKFYKIGNRTDLQILDSVNIVPRFGAGIIFPASGEVFRENFANFVREYVEASDEVLGNGRDIYLLNMLSLAKTNFEEVGYLEYYGLNDYDYSAQRIVIMSDEEILQTVAPDAFVPEFLNIVRDTVNGQTVPKVGLTITSFDSTTGATIS